MFWIHFNHAENVAASQRAFVHSFGMHTDICPSPQWTQFWLKKNIKKFIEKKNSVDGERIDNDVLTHQTVNLTLMFTSNV